MSAIRAVSGDNYAHVKDLYRLRYAIGRDSAAGFKARVEFTTIALRYDLMTTLEGYSLWDAGFEGLGPRALDTCFEMGDSGDVGAEIIRDARAHGYLGKVEAHFSERVLSRWMAIADAQGCLALD